MNVNKVLTKDYENKLRFQMSIANVSIQGGKEMQKFPQYYKECTRAVSIVLVV